MHIGARNIHFQRGHAVLAGQDARQFAEFIGRHGVDIGYDGHLLPRQTGQLVGKKGLHAVVLQAHGVKHPAWRLRHARQRIAHTRLEGQPLDDNAAQAGYVAVGREFLAVAESSRRAENGIFQFQRPQPTVQGHA